MSINFNTTLSKQKPKLLLLIFRRRCPAMQKTAPLLIKYVGSTSKQSIPAAFQAATSKASDAMEKKASHQ